ncbi:---NA---, partial [Paramuricea clavata]
DRELDTLSKTGITTLSGYSLGSSNFDMWILLLLAVPCLAILPTDPPPEKCFAEAATKYITCQRVIGRPAACHCTGKEPACYIKMILSEGSDGQLYINGSQPGPTIIVRYRGVVAIDVYNTMDEDTSIYIFMECIK